ncbi:MAG: sensor histidine kinase [Dorea sp.]|jgi:signal transduction histidine kinase|nr:sensor histidine kinase [Dorea sp.]
MLGGSFLVALLRNGMSITLMLSFFLMLDRPRFTMKKTICYYVIFGLLLLGVYSLWYLFANPSFVKMAAISVLPVIGIFCSLMSSEFIYLSLYKIAAAFYLFSVGTFIGVDVARWWLGGNLWADIIVRFLCYSVILIFTWKKFRKEFLEGIDFLVEEMDLFSTFSLFISVFLGAIMAYWPNLQGFSIFNMVRAFFVLAMAGFLQYTILHLYIHLGKEHYYQTEKELLELNEQLLRSQLDIVSASEKEAARIRHDARHHILLIRDYVEKGDMRNLLHYLEEYREDVENRRAKPLCGHRAVNSILSVYARQAKEKEIAVNIDVGVSPNTAIRDIDWVAILANVFENAIHGCSNSGKKDQEIDIYIAKKRNKIIIQCTNTCASDIRFQKGIPKSSSGEGIGTSSIIKTVSRYNGEVDFAIEDGKFVTRILLNLPERGI